MSGRSRSELRRTRSPDLRVAVRELHYTLALRICEANRNAVCEAVSLIKPQNNILTHSSLAQSVEHLTVNQVVAGSSPAGGAKTKPEAIASGFVLAPFVCTCIGDINDYRQQREARLTGILCGFACKMPTLCGQANMPPACGQVNTG